MPYSNSNMGFDPTVGPKQALPVAIQSDPLIKNQVSDSLNIYNRMNVGDRSALDYVSTNSTPGSTIPLTVGTAHTSAATSASQQNSNEVSLSAYMFVLAEIISTISQEYPALEHEERMNALGYGIGVKILELLKYKQSLPKNFTKSYFASQQATTSINTKGMAKKLPQLPPHQQQQRIISGNPQQPVSLSSLSLEDPQVLQLLLQNTTGNKISIMEKRFMKTLDILQFLHGPVWKYLFGKQSDDLQKSSDANNEYMIIDNNPLISQLCAVNFCNYFVCGMIQGVLEHACFPCKSVKAHIVPDDKWDFKTVYLIILEDQIAEREKL